MKQTYYKSIKSIAALLLLSIAFVACSSDDIDNTQPKTAISSITITQPGYGADETFTRGSKLNKDTIIALGDDMEAEVHIESVADVATRAGETATSSAYTLAAYQNGQLVQKVTGTVTDTQFTPDSELKLAPGTYDFIAYNSGITASENGSQLIAKRENAETARMAVVRNQTVTAGSELSLALDAKHVGSRIHLQLKALMNFTLTDATLSNHEDIPMVGTYNVATNSWDYTKATLPTGLAQQFPQTTKGDPLKVGSDGFGTGSLTYTDDAMVSTAKDYQYFLPTTNANSLTLTFTSGKMYKRDLANKSVKLITKELEANGSYIIQLKLNRLFKYLFNDGTTDYLKNKGDRTPIALVVDDKERIAVALGEGPNIPNWSANSGTDAKKVYGNIQETVGIYNGYDETWNADNSASGQVRGEHAEFTAMQSAITTWANKLKANNVTLSNGMGEGTHRWYLPSIGEIILFYNNIGCSDVTAANVNDAYNVRHILPWYGEGLEREAFLKAGGDIPSQRWTSSTATNQTGAGSGTDRVFHSWTQWTSTIQNGTEYRNQINFNSYVYSGTPHTNYTARAFIRY